MKKIIVLSKSKAKEFYCDEPWICISIDNYDEHPKINATKRMGLLKMSFGDILDQEEASPFGKLFDENDANKILDFVEKFWEQEDVTTIMVHCLAGISRSSAVAAAINKCYNKNHTGEFWTGRFYPNIHVFNMLVNTFNERHPNDTTSIDVVNHDNHPHQ